MRSASAAFLRMTLKDLSPAPAAASKAPVPNPPTRAAEPQAVAGASASKADPRRPSLNKFHKPIVASNDPVEVAKRLAAYAAVDRHVKPGMRIIGIGSGSTVPYVVDRIVQQGHEANMERWFVPTGFQSKELIIQAGLRLGDVDQYPVIDVTIDGADEIDDNLNCIKGGGGCHLREKVLAEAAEHFVLVSDERKNSHTLGTSWTNGIPIEVATFAWATVMRNLIRLGAVEPVLRMGKTSKAGPMVTDNANFIIDAPFPKERYLQPELLLQEIKMLTGVLEVGLFCKMAEVAYFGRSHPSAQVLVHHLDGRREVLEDSNDVFASEDAA